MKFRALRPIYGDYGKDGTPMMVQAGAIFEVPDLFVKKIERLEAKGIIERVRPPIDRKAFTVYQNKMLTPAENKEKK